MAKKVRFDDEMDKQMNEILTAWRSAGVKNISKPDVIRIFIKKYKDDAMMIPHRKPKKREYTL